MVKEFLMLDEITKNALALPQEEKKMEPSVEIQDLTCYWDEVRYVALADIQHSEYSETFTVKLRRTSTT